MKKEIETFQILDVMDFVHKLPLKNNKTKQLINLIISKFQVFFDMMPIQTKKNTTIFFRFLFLRNKKSKDKQRIYNMFYSFEWNSQYENWASLHLYVRETGMNRNLITVNMLYIVELCLLNSTLRSLLFLFFFGVSNS